MGAIKPVEPVVRALKLLEALNRKSASSLGDLRAATGLPKPTLVRLLDTLIAAGYGARISSEAGYRITEHVLALSIGLRFIDRIVDAAMPAMSQFTREHEWPIGLAKVRDGVVALLHSTAPQSPLSFERAGYNRTYPLIPSALGQAYLAFCTAEERRRLIEELLPDAELSVLGMRDTRTLEAHLASVHPGHTVEEVRAETGWDLKLADHVAETPPPGPSELAAIRRFDPDGFWTRTA